MGRQKGRDCHTRGWRKGCHEYGNQASNTATDQINKIKAELRSLGIKTSELRPEEQNGIFNKSYDSVKADIEFILKRGLKGDGIKGKQRLITMLSSYNVIKGLLRWNDENTSTIELRSGAKFPNGLLDKK